MKGIQNSINFNTNLQIFQDNSNDPLNLLSIGRSK